MPKFTRRQVISWPVASIAAATLANGAAAQTAWPSKPIQIVVPYSVGGQTDTLARLFGNFLSKHLGVPVVVINKAGASGVLGVTAAVKSQADGYTILCSLSPALVQNRVLIKNLPYGPERDLIYVTTIDTIGVPIVASEKTGIKSLADLVTYARSKPLNFGAYGTGTIPHVLAGLLTRQYGVPMATIQYRGETPMWTDVRGQVLEVAAGSYAGALPVLQSGRGTLIAVLGDRLPAYPDVPTLIEQGARGEAFGATAFTTFALPSGTAPEIVGRLSRALTQAGSDPQVKEVLATLLAKQPTSLKDAQARFARETTVVLKVLKDLDIKDE